MNTATLINRSLSNRTGQGMLVILDAAVPHRSHLEAGLLPGATLLTLDRDRDGIAQITDYLRAHSGFTSLHLISHGAPGRLDLGSAWVDRDSLAQYQDALASWRTAFSDRFELLLYGCQVGHGAIGRDFVEQLGQMTGAIVAANPSYTGSSNLGGTWNLSTQTAPIQSAIAIAPATQSNYPALLVKYTIGPGGVVVADDVTKSFTAGSVEAALIQAITNANSDAGADTIELAPSTAFAFTTFNINATNEGASALPIITDPDGLTITGLTSGGNLLRRNAPNDSNLANNFRFFTIRDGARLTLNNLILENGRVIDTGPSFGPDGGAILNNGILAINNSTIRNNFAADDGGAIANVGISTGAQLTITNSTFTGNTADGDDNPSGSTPTNDGGGAIENDGGGAPSGTITTLNSVTISNNTATGGTGGAIRARNGADLTIVSSTIQNNVAGAGGGLSFINPNSTFDKINLDISGTSTNPTTISGNTASLFTGTTSAEIATQDLVESVAGTPPAPGNRALVVSSNTLSAFQSGDLAIGAQVASDTGDTQVRSNIEEFQTIEDPFIVVREVGGSDLADEGSFGFGSLLLNSNSGKVTKTFEIINRGNQDLTITGFSTAGLSSPLTVNPSTVTTFNLSKTDAPFQFTLEVDTTAANDFSSGQTFEILTSNASNLGTGDTTFDFSITGSVVETVANLSVDATTGIFTVGSGGGQVQVSVQNSPSGNTIYDLQTTYSNGSGSFTEAMFSVLPAIERPLGFDATRQSFIFDDVDSAALIGGGTFELELLNTNTTFSVNVDAGGTGIHDYTFDTNFDGVYDNRDLTLRVQQVTDAVPLGVGETQATGLEVIDLVGIGDNRTATFNLFREATFNNTVGLYRIDGVNGAVNGLLPGAAGYAREAIANRVSGINLAVGNGATASASGNLTGGALYAPFIIVDSTVDAYLSGGGGEVYFSYASANADGADHVILLGNNTFGFEDLVGGGDRDFNDLIFQVDIV